MKASIITKPGVVLYAETEDPRPGPGEVLIKVKASGICGTDVHIYQGEYIGSYPIIPGHEFAGEVVETGAGVSRIKTGMKIAVEPNVPCDNCENCLNNRQNFCSNWQAVGVTMPGGMARYVVAPEKAVIPLEELSFLEGAFMEPLSCVLHGVKRVGVNPGERILIIGAGPIGLLLLQTIGATGAASIDVTEKNRTRLSQAEKGGAVRLFSDLEKLEKDAYDLVVDATGVPAVMGQTLRFVRPGGRILLFGVPPMGKELAFDAFSIFRKGLSIFSSFTSLRNSFEAIRMISSGKIRVGELVSHQLPLADLDKGINLVQKGSQPVLKVMILPQE